MTTQTASRRIAPIDPTSAQGKARELLAAVQSRLGMTPNLMRTLAHSPAALEGYLSLNNALATGVLAVAIREQLALAIAQYNRCGYCLAAHTSLGKLAGLKPDQVAAARAARASDLKTAAILSLAHQILEARGNVTDQQLSAARAAGTTDAEITEVVAHIALNILTNYFNLTARTEVDFPEVPLA